MKKNATTSRRLLMPSIVVGLLVTAVIAACSSDPATTPPVDPAGSCDALASRCHPYDKTTAIGHECHELGHAGDDKACAPRKDECLAACPPTEAGTPPPKDGSTDTNIDPDATTNTDSGQDSGTDICTPYCQCLTDTCATSAGYPFTGLADCVAKCTPRSAEEKDCWPKFCEKAKTTPGLHTCEHAWGAHALDECDTL